jgi:hypothetical protein
MNTNKIRLIKRLVIRNPELKTIRDNLRTLVSLAVLDEFRRLDNLEDLYIGKKLTPSQFRRSCQLHEMKEYLTTTFSNSICVCASRHIMGSTDVSGDRVRYTLITEFDKDVVKNIGARYEIQEKWFSLPYYEERSEFLERYLRKMSNLIKGYSGHIITPFELHEQELHELQKITFT